MFFLDRKKTERQLKHKHTSVSSDIRRYDARFATNQHGLQMFNGPNPVKVCKTIALLSLGVMASFGVSALTLDDLFTKIFGGLVLSLITIGMLAQQATALGERRRTGSNFVTRAAISWGLFTHNVTRSEAEHIASDNAFYNLFNGGEKIFDDLFPEAFKNLVEHVVNQQSREVKETRLR